MASYLRPRRGKLATAKAQLTASAPLKRGEVFFEVPDTGVGTGTGKIKMGDGSTAYESLPYFMVQPTVDYDNAVVAWTNTTAADSNPYSTNSTYIGNIVPTANLKTIFTNLKKLLLNFNSQVTTLNNDLDNKAPANHNHDSRYYTESEIDNKLAFQFYNLDTSWLTDIYCAYCVYIPNGIKILNIIGKSKYDLHNGSQLCVVPPICLITEFIDSTGKMWFSIKGENKNMLTCDGDIKSGATMHINISYY